MWSLCRGLAALSFTLFAGGVVQGGKVEIYGHDVAVETCLGTVKGTIDKATPNVRQFLGIPYAKPPLGNLRFAPPQPTSTSPRGIIDATKFGPSCMQFLTGDAGGIVPEFNVQGLNTTGWVSEDCLSLSIWTPVGADSKKNLPVLVFLYGGAFQAGGQNVPYQIPAQWVQQSQEHIVVTINYRVNVFGFPNAAGLKEQNLGILDQRLALKWVHRNIALFGGDATRIVLWGQSAGAISTAYHAYAFPEDPIVSGFILDSGTEYLIAPKKVDGKHTDFSGLAGLVGCGNLTADKELNCMRKLPAEKISDTMRDGKVNLTALFFFTPVADEKLLFSNYTARALDHRIAKVPAIIGTNAQDGGGGPPNNTTTPITDLIQLAFDCSAWSETSNRLKAGVPTFRYRYYGNFSNIAPDPYSGAYHSSELPLLFGTHSLYRGWSSELEWATSAAMQKAWVDFAKGGAHRWPLFDNKMRSFKIFGNDTAVKDINYPDMDSVCTGLT